MQVSHLIDANASEKDLRMSLVMATCNRAGQLDQALDSLNRQSVASKLFEVIVVDNGSNDSTEAVVQSYLKKQPHWKYIREPKPGASAARNAGVRACRAPIVLFLDDDIVADPELIEQHLKSQQESPAVAVLGQVRFPWKGTESPFFWCLSRHPELYQSFQFPDSQNVPFQYFYTCNLSLPRSFFDQGNGFDEEFTASGFEDTELGYRFVNAGFRIVFNEKASALHNVRTTFQQFARKRYASGQWARRFIGKYPEVRATFLGWSPLKIKASNLIGMLATPLKRLFDLAESRLNRPLQPVLGVLCWHHLQYRFRAGYCANSASPGSILAKTKSD
ncbi:MAG TPA: glycosyltransferase [Terriglobales bacterium]|jgi:glycosyltransferase involved in cell wall biosynthesis|nr:glycosyltransferase [Terriglobales bacterium]